MTPNREAMERRMALRRGDPLPPQPPIIPAVIGWGLIVLSFVVFGIYCWLSYIAPETETVCRIYCHGRVSENWSWAITGTWLSSLLVLGSGVFVLKKWAKTKVTSLQKWVLSTIGLTVFFFFAGLPEREAPKFVPPEAPAVSPVVYDAHIGELPPAGLEGCWVEDLGTYDPYYVTLCYPPAS